MPAGAESNPGNGAMNARDLFEGNYPGLPRQLSRLRDSRLGRAIESFGDKDNGPRYYGQILPLSAENNRHIVLLTDGSIVIVEPNSPNDLSHYRNIFGASPEPLRLNRSLQGVSQELMTGIGFPSKVMLRGDDPNQVETVRQAIDTALTCAQEERDRRLQAQEGNDQYLLRRLEDFFKPTTSSQDPSPN